MMSLRPYQEKAVSSVSEQWLEHPSTLLVMPTGTGKTVAFTEIIKRNLPGRAIIVAHRSELVYQAVEHLRRRCVEAHVEMADEHASTTLWGRSSVVVASVQTLCAGNNGGRMTNFNPNDFSLLILDECHHATASTWRRTIEHFKQNPDLKILGVTATPDRADEEALGQVFSSVAFDYEIIDAIKDGWLVPIEQQMVTIEGLDFSHIRTTAGDLNGADLAEVMELEKNLHGVVSSTIGIVGNRRTLLFAVSVHQAEMYAEIFNRHRPGMAKWMCGATPKDERWNTLREFASGKIQIVCNVGVLTEGYDNPAIEVVVMARPTKSRCLYAQCCGRGTRPAEFQGRSIVDSFPSAEARREAIRLSSKPSLLVVDFAGNSGRHKLVTTADLLGGNVTDDVIERAAARAKIDGKPVRMAELLEEEVERMRKEKEERERREAARKVRLVGKATYSTLAVDPFNVFDIRPGRERGWEKGKTFSEKQLNLLRKQGIDPEKINYHQGQQIIGELVRRWTNKLCTLKQANLLKKNGYDPKNMKMTDASKLIDALAKNHWKRPVDEPAEVAV